MGKKFVQAQREQARLVPSRAHSPTPHPELTNLPAMAEPDGAPAGRVRLRSGLGG
jgi:hypothetical protein